MRAYTFAEGVYHFFSWLYVAGIDSCLVIGRKDTHTDTEFHAKV